MRTLLLLTALLTTAMASAQDDATDPGTVPVAGPGAAPATNSGAAPATNSAAPPATNSAAPPATASNDAPDVVKTLSGMSVLGNEETPTALVIVPWKSSRLGDGLGIGNALDESPRAVDKEVFMRELHFYGLRSGSSAD